MSSPPRQGVRALRISSSSILCVEMLVISVLLATNCDEAAGATNRGNLPNNYSSKNLVATRFGILQCRPKQHQVLSRAPDGQPGGPATLSGGGSNKHNHQLLQHRPAIYTDEEIGGSAGQQLSGGAGNDDDVDSDTDNADAAAEDSSPPPEGGQSLSPKVIVLPEDTDDAAQDDYADEEPSPEPKRRRNAERRSKTPTLVWRQINGGRLLKPSPSKLEADSDPKRRQRRQAPAVGPPEETVAAAAAAAADEREPLELAAREVLGLRPRRPNLIAPETMQQLMRTMLQFLQQFLGVFVGQMGVAELPTRMANFGQLLANIITALTVNNPVLTSSPLLQPPRNQSSFPLVAASSSSAPSASASASSTTTNLRADTAILDSLGRLVKTLASMQRQLLAASNASSSPVGSPLPAPASQQQTAGQSAEAAAASQQDSSTGMARRAQSLEALKEAEFMNRLNQLTWLSYQQAAQQQNATNSTTSAGSGSSTADGPRRAFNRRKRSLASMLMFGPMGKLYMAMMMNRMLRYQSNMVSQAVMGELVRRLLVPAMSSALGSGNSSSSPTNVLGGALNQIRQSLVGALAGSGGFQQPAAAPGQRQKLAQADASLLLDADCQLVSELDQQQQPQPRGALNMSSPSAGEQPPSSTTTTTTTTTTPASLLGPLGSAALAAAMNVAPLMSLDQQGLHMNAALARPPILPGLLFGGGHAGSQLLQAMLKQLTTEPAANATGDASQSLLQLAGSPQQLGGGLSFGGLGLGRLLSPPIVGPPPPPSVGVLAVRRPSRKPTGSPYDWPGESVGSSLLPLDADQPFGPQPGSELGPIWPPIMQQRQQQQQQPATTQLRLEDRKLLDEFVASASPGQLLALLGQLNQSAEFAHSGPLLAPPAPSNSSAGNFVRELESATTPPQQAEQQFEREQPARRLKSPKGPTQTPPPPPRADELADHSAILDRTLERLAAKNLWPQAQRKEPASTRAKSSEQQEDKLAGETSRLLASSLAQLLKSLNLQGSNSTDIRGAANSSSSSLRADDVQITLSADNAAKLVNKVLSAATSQPAAAAEASSPPAQSGLLAEPTTGKLARDPLVVSPPRSVGAAPVKLPAAPRGCGDARAERAPTKADKLEASRQPAVGGQDEACHQQPNSTLSQPNPNPNPNSNSTAASEQPLNNLAMALNVMNMVLLNKKLTAPTEIAPAPAPAKDSNATSAEASAKQTRRKIARPIKRTTTTTTTTERPAHNHRMASNSRLTSNGSLLIVGQPSDRQLTKRPADYHYQPLPVPPPSSSSSSSWPSFSSADKVQERTKLQAANNSAGPEELEHASRWNDVLQHITLAG